MNYELKHISEEEYTLAHHRLEQATILQSYQWGEIKTGWQRLPFGFYANQKLIGTVLILKKQLPLRQSFFYIPKGPIMAYEKETVTGFVKELKRIAKEHHAVFVRLDPPILRSAFKMDEEPMISNQDQVQTLVDVGFEHEPLTLDLHATIQPRFQAVVECKEFQLQRLTKKGRQGVQTAKKRGVELEMCGMEKVAIFAELMKKTAAENQTKKKNKLVVTKNSLEKELVQLEQDITIHGQKERYISGTLTVPYGDTCELLYAGMDEAFKHYMPAYYTWYESIVQAGKRGYSYCNLGGIDGHLNDGLIQFKKIFQPLIHEYSGEFNLRTSNWLIYKAVKKAYQVKMRG